MATGIEINSTSISLPESVSSEIIQKTQEGSAVMALARAVNLPGLGMTIPVITNDPTAEWVDETAEKPVSRPTLATKHMKPYTLAVIVPFSNQFRNNMTSLYSAIVERLPLALAQKFDSTVFHGTAPGTGFDTLASATAVALGSTAYQSLVTIDENIATAGGITNGYVLAPQGKAKLLRAVDGDGRPIFINNVSEGAVPMILGAKTLLNKAAYKAGATTGNDIIGVAGDWTKAMYGISQNINLSISDQATLTDGSGDEAVAINLWQRNMFAVRCEIEIGFVADTTAFNLIKE